MSCALISICIPPLISIFLPRITAVSLYFTAFSVYHRHRLLSSVILPFSLYNGAVCTDPYIFTTILLIHYSRTQKRPAKAGRTVKCNCVNFNYSQDRFGKLFANAQKQPCKCTLFFTSSFLLSQRLYKRCTRWFCRMSYTLLL